MSDITLEDILKAKDILDNANIVCTCQTITFCEDGECYEIPPSTTQEKCEFCNN